jgi:hypothetical protein
MKQLEKKTMPTMFDAVKFPFSTCVFNTTQAVNKDPMMKIDEKKVLGESHLKTIS